MPGLSLPPDFRSRAGLSLLPPVKNGGYDLLSYSKYKKKCLNGYQSPDSLVTEYEFVLIAAHPDWGEVPFFFAIPDVFNEESPDGLPFLDEVCVYFNGHIFIPKLWEMV